MMRSLLLLPLLLSFTISGQATAPAISPTPQPYLPELAPSPLIPFTNFTNPVLSGLCRLNFSSVESLTGITATDCWASFAPFLANVMCCPQLDAALLALLGHSSTASGYLALNATHSEHCLADFNTILTSKGANSELPKICLIQPDRLTQASCPVFTTYAFERTVNSSKIISACEKIDLVNECCDRVCHDAIAEAAQKLAFNGGSGTDGTRFSREDLKTVDDCKDIVLRWLASKLDPRSANTILRGLSNCKVNEACPLVFPNTSNVTKECRNVIRSKVACCEAVDEYMVRMQEQSFITNVQALNCAALLGKELQKVNVSENIYDLCHITIKDFSLQVGSQEWGCLLPSSPSDAMYDKASGISFICDINDNIAAPWPSSSFQPVSLCNKTAKIPSLPKATSAQAGSYRLSSKLTYTLLLWWLMTLLML